MRNRNSRRALGRKRGLASAAAWQPGEPDADTLRQRAHWDAKGQPTHRAGCTYTAAGETHWHVRRSLHGRTNQFDLVANGRVVRTCGSRRMGKRFNPTKL